MSDEETIRKLIEEYYRKGYSRDAIGENLKVGNNFKVGHRRIQSIIDDIKNSPSVAEEHNLNMLNLRKQKLEERKEIINNVDIDYEIINVYKQGIPIREIQERFHISAKTIDKKIKENTEDYSRTKNEHRSNYLNENRTYQARDADELIEILNAYRNGTPLHDIGENYHISINQIKKYIDDITYSKKVKAEREKNKELNREEYLNTRNIEVNLPDRTEYTDNPEKVSDLFGRNVEHPNFDVYGRLDLIKPISMELYIMGNDLTKYGDETATHRTSVITKGIKTRNDYNKFLEIIKDNIKLIDKKRMPYIKDFKTGVLYLFNPNYNAFPEYEVDNF